MASIAAFSSLSSSICTTNSYRISTPSSSSSHWTYSVSLLRHQRRNTASFALSRWLANKKKFPQFCTRIKAVAEETLVPEEEKEESPVTDQTVSVPVSPSDMLTMFFQAEGTMSEAAVSKVTKALEEVEDVSDLKVQILEGIASVELTKQTTVQATGVASSLVEVIQGSGFKLQTLNLSFEDEEDTTS